MICGRYVDGGGPDVVVVRLCHEVLPQPERLSLELEEVHEDLEGGDVEPGGQRGVACRAVVVSADGEEDDKAIHPK